MSSKSSDKLSLFDACGMAIGGMVGGGIFAVLGEAVVASGNATFISLGLGGVLALLTGLSYSKLTVKFDEPGGGFTFMEHIAGVRFAGTISWFLILGYVFTISLYAYTFGAYAGRLFGFGTEFRDIQPFGSGGGYRYSDAALIDLEEGVSTNFGAISNTNTYSTVWGTDGSIEMGSFYTYESIIGDGIQYLDGALIYKIGRSSGKTRGTVNATCVDASNVTGYPSGFTMRCQIRSSTYARGGDSGAPVYYSNLYFPQARLIGIHWGSSDEQQVSLHSPISAVKSELTQGSETMTTH